MRLWHKDLIPVLPKQQLLGQWRECCCIARNIAVNGTPNHLLVNKIMDYPAGHFWKYGYLVMCEMDKRGFRCDFEKFEQWIDKPYALITPEVQDLFPDWHNDRYLMQCFFNLQEKFDCGGILEDEWQLVEAYFKKSLGIQSPSIGVDMATGKDQTVYIVKKDEDTSCKACKYEVLCALDDDRDCHFEKKG